MYVHMGSISPVELLLQKRALASLQLYTLPVAIGYYTVYTVYKLGCIPTTTYIRERYSELQLNTTAVKTEFCMCMRSAFSHFSWNCINDCL